MLALSNKPSAQAEEKSSTESDDVIEVLTSSKSVGTDDKDVFHVGDSLQKRVKNAFHDAFIREFLPQLPKFPNGMVLLAAHEQSPLLDCGEVYKARMCRPDVPIGSSEVFESNCTVRFTNHARLISDECQVMKGWVLSY